MTPEPIATTIPSAGSLKEARLSRAKGRIGVAVAQSFSVPGDPMGNLARMEPLVKSASEDGAKIVLFAECGVTGYTPDSPPVVPGDAVWKALCEMSARHGIVVAAGFLERSPQGIHNTHGAFFPNGRVVVQRKVRAADVEKAMPEFVQGSGERPIFEVGGLRCAIAICADYEPDKILPDLIRAGVGLVLVPTGGCGPRSMGFTEKSLEDPEVFERYLTAAESVVFSKEPIRLCRSYKVALAACNHMADDGVGYFHPGHSSVVDSTGELSALIPGVFVFEHLRPQVAVGLVSVPSSRRAAS